MVTDTAGQSNAIAGADPCLRFLLLTEAVETRVVSNPCSRVSFYFLGGAGTGFSGSTGFSGFNAAKYSALACTSVACFILTTPRLRRLLHRPLH